MKLLYQNHSPFARKTLVFAHEVGLASEITVEPHETSPLQRNDLVFELNPLGKVPILVLDDGFSIFDSRTICEFLNDVQEGESLIPSSPRERYADLRLSSLADGIAEAGIAARWEGERRPPSSRFEPLLEGLQSKLRTSYDYLEVNAEFEAVTLGTISLAAALSWIEFRDQVSFRPGHPRLAEWFDAFCERPSMLATKLSGNTVD